MCLGAVERRWHAAASKPQIILINTYKNHIGTTRASPLRAIQPFTRGVAVSYSKWIVIVSGLCVAGCGSEVETEDNATQQQAVTKQQVIYDAHNGAVNPQSQDDLIPYRYGNGAGRSAPTQFNLEGKPSIGCNVYYAYESPDSFPASGASVPVNKGYAYMTGNVDDCIALCASWKKSFTKEPREVSFVHRQLFYYSNYHWVVNAITPPAPPSYTSHGFMYNMECMALDRHQDCLPIFGKDGYLGEHTYGTTYCANN